MSERELLYSIDQKCLIETYIDYTKHNIDQHTDPQERSSIKLAASTTVEQLVARDAFPAAYAQICVERVQARKNRKR